MGGGDVENDEIGLKMNLLLRGREIWGNQVMVSGRPESPGQRLVLNVTGLKLGSSMDGYVPLAEVEVTSGRSLLELTSGMSRM